ncbi:MAG: hypothetical protein EBR26_03620, partial [Microbacteriaceae bacterium]|nr:hypothetical protein [Microbacteriaceae bacterium]
MALTHIDLNADLGETEGDYLDLLNVVSSANVACGAHAGGGELLRDTVAAAIKRGVQVGAHPSYQDRENFGRVSMRASITEVELREILIDQVNQVKNTLIEFGSNLSHIKAHGALYNDAMVFADTANVLCNVAAFFEVPILGLPGSTLETQAQIEG